MRRSGLVSVVLVLVALVVLSLPVAAADSPSAKISDLSWMTGTWSGAAGPGTLEENWTVPMSGSIQALVRMTSAEATSMVELIVIEEVEGSLTLHLQQWDPGFKPRPGGPQTMRLVEAGKNMVKFEATSEGWLKTLSYSRPEADQFVISIETAQGQKFDLPLKAK